MDRLTKHQVLPPQVIRVRIKQRLFKFMYEHDDMDFLDVMAQLLQYITESRNYGAETCCTLDCKIDTFLKSLDQKDTKQGHLI